MPLPLHNVRRHDTVPARQHPRHPPVCSLFLSDISLSYFIWWCCSALIWTMPGAGVSPMAPKGVAPMPMPGVAPKAGVAPKPPAAPAAGVSSQRERCRPPGVAATAGVSPKPVLTAAGVSSHLLRRAVAPAAGVASQRLAPGVASSPAPAQQWQHVLSRAFFVRMRTPAHEYTPQHT